jgi:hypothetical protein
MLADDEIADVSGAVETVEDEHIIARSIQGGRGNDTIVAGMGAGNVYAKTGSSI